MFTLPKLPYDYSALEPYIDTETMHFHYDKHHAGYVKNLNDLLQGHDDLLNLKIEDLLKSFDKVPKEIRQKVINNAGGVANHTLFWQIMAPSFEAKIPESGRFFEIVKSTFDSFEKFKEKFTEVALGHFGSGWAWLVVESGKLEVVDTMNQDSPVTKNLNPILALDVWEHAYYLKYKNARAEYIKAWWNVVNWKEVERLYNDAI
jgi:Fe-Mn family superoxide dismutase